MRTVLFPVFAPYSNRNKKKDDQKKNCLKHQNKFIIRNPAAIPAVVVVTATGKLGLVNAVRKNSTNGKKRISKSN